MKLHALAAATFSILSSLGAASAQQVEKVHRVGYLQIAPRVAQEHLIEAFERD